ncbi:MAG: rhamnogalacturonan lyase [Prolixibacteraceae bacterium]|nr:rhamnogalacturonan lyase [Prolixibacteraceae bacterium]
MKIFVPIIILLLITLNLWPQRILENLDRGVVALPVSEDSVFISWRLLQTDADTIAFNVYRCNDNDTIKLNTLPIKEVSWFIDSKTNRLEDYTYTINPSGSTPEFNAGNSYHLTNIQPAQYLSVPLQLPPPSEANGRKYFYTANDASVGDLDGDGEYEIVLKWSPSATRNPPQPGITGITLFDAYKLDGTFLWRINLGKNIRSGSAYTQFLVYDLDGDGKAEMICKTADGTFDGQGMVIGDVDKDWRNLDPDSKFYGKIVEGPEYLTVFEGTSGKALATVEYIPTRYPLNRWGGIGGNGNNDDNGGRADRFLACVANLYGKLPSAVFIRGIYGRTVASAWDYRNGKLTNRWIFDSENGENPYSGMGNHQLSVADVDHDGKDEICIGAMTIDDNGKGLYTTGLRHGDALHLTDIDPDHPGLEVYGIHENEGKTVALNTPGVALYDAATGKILFSLGPGADVGRGVAADIDPTHPGLENWGGPGGLRDAKGNTISRHTPSSTNFVVWWDGDLTRELLDKNRIDKWDWEKQETRNLLTAEGCSSNNWTKATPCLSADILGDWREEVIWRTQDSRELRIYVSTIPTPYRFTTLMHDPQYRLSIAWQNVGYNQPPHPGFYLGAGMK